MNNRSDNELYDLCKSKKLSIGALQETINLLGPRLSSQNPLCFHKACKNKKVTVTLAIVQLLHNTLPGALQLRDDNERLPIHHLCANQYLDDINSLDILRFMLEIDPTLLSEMGNGGWLPIHYAVKYKSIAFCKILIDAYPESLRVASYVGMLPIHVACAYGKREDVADTIQYMLELDPELINVANSGGWLPIHFAAEYGGTELIELLLEYDPDAASKEINNGSRLLPLHCACEYDDLSKVQLLYDAYPDAIFARAYGRTPVDLARNQPTILISDGELLILISDEDGDTPVDDARREENTIIVDFLETQLVYARQANEHYMTVMATLGDDGCLPLHRALTEDNVPLGSIKLLTRASPAALQVADEDGAYPLHIACEFSSVKVVKYLVELAGDTLNSVDANNTSPLHYACRGGSLNVLKYLLEANVPSISERNNDNKLAIHLLFECGENTLDRESMEYVETVWQLLLANPEVVREFMHSHAAAATRKKRKADDEGNAGDGEEDSNRKVPVNILMPKSNNENGGEGRGDDEVEDDEVKRMKWKVQTQMAVEAKRQKYTRLAEDRTRELEKLCRHISALKELQAKLDEKNEQKVAIENEIKAMSTYLRERQSADVMDDIDKEFTDALQAYDSKVEEVKEEHANIVKRLNEMREWADRFTISVEGVSTPSSTLHAWGKSLEFDVWLQMALRGAKKLDFENEES